MAGWFAGFLCGFLGHEYNSRSMVTTKEKTVTTLTCDRCNDKTTNTTFSVVIGSPDINDIIGPNSVTQQEYMEKMRSLSTSSAAETLQMMDDHFKEHGVSLTDSVYREQSELMHQLGLQEDPLLQQRSGPRNKLGLEEMLDRSNKDDR